MVGQQGQEQSSCLSPVCKRWRFLLMKATDTHSSYIFWLKWANRFLPSGWFLLLDPTLSYKPLRPLHNRSCDLQPSLAWSTLQGEILHSSSSRAGRSWVTISHKSLKVSLVPRGIAALIFTENWQEKTPKNTPKEPADECIICCTGLRKNIKRHIDWTQERVN